MFRDRKEAALLLAEKLKKFENTGSIVLAIPRGGVVIGYEISKHLNLPLEIVLIKKIGHPFNREYSIGAVSLFGAVINDSTGIPQQFIRKEINRARNLLEQKHDLYLPGKKPADMKGKTAIIVDDGIATGNTMLAIIDLLRESEASKIIIAVPVASRSMKIELSRLVDEVIILTTPDDFHAVSQVYEEFGQVSDDKVISLIRNSAHVRHAPETR